MTATYAPGEAELYRKALIRLYCDATSGDRKTMDKAEVAAIAGRAIDKGNYLSQSQRIAERGHAILKAEWQAAFDALKASGVEHDADDPIAERYRRASDAVNHSSRKREAAALRGLVS